MEGAVTWGRAHQELFGVEAIGVRAILMAVFLDQEARRKTELAIESGQFARADLDQEFPTAGSLGCQDQTGRSLHLNQRKVHILNGRLSRQAGARI